MEIYGTDPKLGAMCSNHFHETWGRNSLQKGQVIFCLFLHYKNSLKSRLALDMAYLGGQFPGCASCGCRWICVSTACLQALTFGHNDAAVIVGVQKIPRIRKSQKQTNKQTNKERKKERKKQTNTQTPPFIIHSHQSFHKKNTCSKESHNSVTRFQPFTFPNFAGLGNPHPQTPTGNPTCSLALAPWELWLPRSLGFFSSQNPWEKWSPLLKVKSNQQRRDVTK